MLNLIGYAILLFIIILDFAVLTWGFLVIGEIFIYDNDYSKPERCFTKEWIKLGIIKYERSTIQNICAVSACVLVGTLLMPFVILAGVIYGIIVLAKDVKEHLDKTSKKE